MFGLFLVSWVYTRHYLFNRVLYATIDGAWRHVKSNSGLEYGISETIYYSFLILLGALQIVLCVWFYMIARIAYKVVVGQGADDSRSENGDSDEESDQGDIKEDDDDDDINGIMLKKD